MPALLVSKGWEYRLPRLERFADRPPARKPRLVNPQSPAPKRLLPPREGEVVSAAAFWGGVAASPWSSYPTYPQEIGHTGMGGDGGWPYPGKLVIRGTACRRLATAGP